MDNLFSSFVLGLIFICLFYCICLFLVVGIKIVYLSIKTNFIKPEQNNQVKQPLPAVKEQKPRIRKPRTVRSIEINPDDVDRIYVRKSS